MKENNEGIRKTIYIDEQLVKRSEIMFGEAGVHSFSAFVAKAIEFYIDQLVVNNHGATLTAAMRKAIREEIEPTNRRLSKGLYRYAVILDALLQTVGWRCKITSDALERIHKDANRRVAQMKGKIDLGELVAEDDEEGESL